MAQQGFFDEALLNWYLLLMPLESDLGNIATRLQVIHRQNDFLSRCLCLATIFFVFYYHLIGQFFVIPVK